MEGWAVSFLNEREESVYDALVHRLPAKVKHKRIDGIPMLHMGCFAKMVGSVFPADLCTRQTVLEQQINYTEFVWHPQVPARLLVYFARPHTV